MKKKLSLILCIGVLSCIMSGCVNDKNNNLPIENFSINNDEHILWLGRTEYNLEEKVKYFNYTASGFIVNVKGSYLKIELASTNFQDDKNFAIVSITVNDEIEPSIWALNEQTKELKVELDSSKINTVKLLKRSEAAMSKSGLYSLKTDGNFYKPPVLKERKIEVFGDSVTCGYGNMADSGSEKFSTLTEDGTNTYATLTAKNLNSEVNIIAASGWAMKQNVWNNPQNIPDLFNKTDFYSEKKWEYKNYQPQIVVINLGANDNTFINSATNSTEKQARIDAFILRYKEFIFSIQNVYKDVKIICAYGMMGESSTMKNYILEVVEKVDDNNVTILELPSLNQQDGIGADGHPSLKTHQTAANVLIENIKKIMKW